MSLSHSNVSFFYEHFMNQFTHLRSFIPCNHRLSCFKYGLMYVYKNTTVITNNTNTVMLLYTNIDQTLVNLLHGLLNCEISGLN